MAVNQQAASAFQTWADGNPEIQRILLDPRYAGNSGDQRKMRQAAIHAIVVKNAQHIPPGLKINADGRLETDDQSGLPGWAKGLLIGGGAAAAMFGVPAIAGMFGAGAPAAAAGGAAGIGESGAVTGLAGSGFGGSALAGSGFGAALPATVTAAGGSALPSGVAGMTGSSMASGAAGAPWWQTALKYGAPIVAGAVESGLNQKNNAAALAERRYEADQGTALAESKLDPFRGVMAQTNDLKTLEHRSQGPRSYAPPASSPYAGAVNPANQAPALSPSYQLAVQNAQDTIAQGQGTVPTMTNPANYGQTGTQNLTTGRLRRRPLAPPDPLGTYWL